MQLRIAFARAVRFLRSHKGLSQQELGKGLDRTHISRLETGRHNPTIESSESVAQSMDVDPLSLLVVAYAIKRGATPREILEQLSSELGSHTLLDQHIADDVPVPPHPQITKAAETHAAVQALKEQGFTRVEAAQALGVSRSTANRNWN